MGNLDRDQPGAYRKVPPFASAMPKLLVMLPDSGEVSHDLSAPVITLGRLDENTLPIDDPSV